MINLLPSEIKNQYKVRSKVFGVFTVYLMILAVIGIGFAIIFSINLVNQSLISDREAKLSNLVSQTKQNDSLTTQAALVESRVNAAAQYQEKELWSQVMGKIASLTPTNIQLTNLKVAIDNTKKTTLVTLTGVSTDRRTVILYKDKLATEKTFLSPFIQSLADGADSTSTFTFGIQFTLKNQTK